MEHKSGGAPGDAGWATLTHPLMNIIFAKIYGSHRYAPFQAILDLRLVCKGWRDACSDFTGSAYIQCEQDTGLLKSCKLLPALCRLKLDILHPEADACFNLLSHLTSLRALAVLQNFSSEKTPLRGLRHLPSTLKQLSLRGMAIDPLFANINFTGLTYLSCYWPENFGEGAFSLLQHLPALQELHFHLPDYHGGARGDLGAVFRCGSLTKIMLSSGRLHNHIHMPASASTLRDIHLHEIPLSALWLYSMSPLLTSLTHLELVQCAIYPEVVQPQAIGSLRSLDMVSSAPGLLHLAGPDLQRLKYSHHTLEAQHFATFRALTHLELEGVSNCYPAGVRPFANSTQLLELSLEKSDIMTEALLLPGTQPVLQKVHLVERVKYRLDSRCNIVNRAEVDLQATGPKAQELHRAVFSHPSLSEVSGKCRLFLLGIPDKWIKCSGAEGNSLVDRSHPQLSFRERAKLMRKLLEYPEQVWRKIQ